MLRVLKISVFTVFALASCGANPNTNNTILNFPPVLSWTSSWSSGTQSGTIAFPAVGQTAVLTATIHTGGYPPPYSLSAGACVALSNESSSNITETVTVTAANAGACTITVASPSGLGPAATIQATVP